MPHVQTEWVRYLLVPLLAATLAATATAATVDPQDLVIRSTDVPKGYVLVRAESGVRTNELEARETPATRELFRRLGRVTGYQVMFKRGNRTVEARADVFRSWTGARELLRRADREARLAGVKALKRSRARVGAEAWLYTGGSPPYASFVFWRYGRVWAGLGGRGMTKQRALDLAKIQQSRMVAALR